MLNLVQLDTYDQPLSEVIASANIFFVLSGSVDEREEGDVIVPTFSVTVQNPGAAWLSSQPPRYAALVEKRESDADWVELARGRLSILPTELSDVTCDLEYFCLPPDDDDVLKAAANALRLGEVDYDPDAAPALREAAEVYDPLFFSPEATDDPTNVLAATMDVWRWNRLTLQPERVHLINGAVQHVIAGATAGTHKSARMSIRNPPKAVSRLRLIASWTQAASGDQPTEFMGTWHIDTYNYKSFIDGMPKPGTAIGTSTGWTIAEAEIKGIEDLLPQTYSYNLSSVWGGTSQQKVTVQAKRLTIGMRAHYEYQQEREEIIDIFMTAGVQPILDDDKTETVEQITLSALTLDIVTPDWIYEDPDTLVIKHYLVGDQRQANGKVWQCTFEHDATETFTANLFDPETGEVAQNLWIKVPKKSAINARSSRFADIARGKRAVRHGLRRLHRIVQRRARAAEVSFEVPWKVGRMITCADECRVENRTWPGGELVGKVVGVQLQIDGASRAAVITLGVSVGTGVAPADPVGGQQKTADIVYDVTAPGVNAPVNVDGLDGKSPRILVVDDDADVQNAQAFNASSFGGNPIEAIELTPTKLRIYFDPLRQEDLITRRISAHTQPIYVRKGIDLTPEMP